MKANDVLILALKKKVTAISKADGRHLWTTALSGGDWGGSGGFVTVACDRSHVFAYSDGHLHCLDLVSGRLLWTNDLPGYGHGLASLCLPGYGAAPNLAAVQHLTEQASASAASAAPVSVAAI